MGKKKGRRAQKFGFNDQKLLSAHSDKPRASAQHHNAISTNPTSRINSEKPSQHANPSAAGSIFASQKRNLTAINFVSSKEKGRQPYVFKDADRPSNGAKIEQAQHPVESGPKSNQTLDSILDSKKKSNRDEIRRHTDESKGLSSIPENEQICTNGNPLTGQLSGLSVEDAVQDKVGLRPRANSTDGELNLPQRGLCDERTVLESYKWHQRNLHASKPTGFNNLGNTCFLNSTLQCLAYLPPFCQSLLTLDASSQPNRKISHGKRVTHILRNLFSQAHRVNGSSQSTGTLAPRAIVKAVPSLGSCGSRRGYKFRHGRQEDAHEFLVHLLDAMNDGELKDAGINQHASGWRDRLPVPRLDETTFIHRIFGGYFRSQVQCTKCQFRSNTYDPFLDLSLEVSKKTCLSVGDAVREFTRKEKLDSANRWKCSGCKKRVCATKQLTIFRPPLSLCIQLKRFTFSSGFSLYAGFGGGRGGGSKISKQIAFPSRLELPLSDGRSCCYALTGLVIHVGPSASSGHYTAYVRKPSKDNKSNWYYMDDSFVQPCPEKTVLKQRDAYLLFYSREEVKLELPVVPMSNKEAVEFSRVKARARANSLSENPNNNEQANSSPLNVKAKAAIKTPSSPQMQSQMTNRPPIPVSKAQGDEVSSDEEVATSKPKLPHTAAASTGSTSSSVREDEATTEDKEDVEQPSNGVHPSDGESSSDGIASEEESHNASTGLHSLASNVNIDHATPSKAIIGPMIAEEGAVTTSSTKRVTAKTPDPPRVETSVVARRPVADGDRTNTKGKVSNSVTVDRGAGREKVEVVMANRKRKAWQPKVGARPKSTDDYALLGNQKVSKWDDDDDHNKDLINNSKETESGIKESPVAASSTKKQRAALVKAMDKKHSKRKRNMFGERWDSLLDQGHAKKVKKKKKDHYGDGGGSFNKNNPFDQIQRGVRIIHKGRGPKRHISSPSHKHKKKKRRK